MSESRAKLTYADLQAIWSEATCRQPEELDLSRLRGSPHARRLLKLDVDRLQRGAAAARQDWGQDGLPLNRWADAAESLPRPQRLPGQTRLPTWLNDGKRDALVAGLRRLAAGDRQALSKSFDTSEQLIVDAVQRLRHRIWLTAQAEPLVTYLQRRPARWIEPAGSAGVRIPIIDIIDADEVEQLIVTLLAFTREQFQFGVTPKGNIFPSDRRGWWRPGPDRLEVDGLSDILDSASPLLVGHRDGHGGRMYVDELGVLCAACRRYLAWIARTPRKSKLPTASGLCASRHS